MRKTSEYIISLILFVLSIPLTAQEKEEVKPDSVIVPLKIRAGLELAGPVIYITDHSILNLEGFVNYDLNEKYSLSLSGGFTDYGYSQYNYSFNTRGSFYKVGADLNLLRPEIAEGRYWAGIGIRYGITRFNAETQSLIHKNYWGTTSASIPSESNWAHFAEVTGGFRAELFRNFSIGWMVSLRKLLFTGAASDLRPPYYPGIGNSGSSFSFGLGYFISFNIPYKKIKVQIKPEPVEEPEEEDETDQSLDNNNNLGRQRMGVNQNFR